MLVYGDPRTTTGRFLPPQGDGFEPGVLREALLRVLKVTGPLAVLGLFTLGVHLFAPQLFHRTVSLLALYFAPFGMEASVPVALGMGVPPLYLAALMFLFDVAVAATLVLNLEYSKQLPFIGRFVERLERGSLRVWNRHPWLERAGFAGLMIFVFLPIAGTGSSTGAVLGKITGMGVFRLMGAVVLGTALRIGALVGVAAGALALF